MIPLEQSEDCFKGDPDPTLHGRRCPSITFLFTAFWVTLASCRIESIPTAAVDSDLDQIKTEANELFVRSSYSESAEVYRRGFERAEQKRAPRYMAWFLIGSGNCAQLQFNYGDSVEYYLQARRWAEYSANPEVLSAAIASLGSIYWRMGDLSAALSAFEEALKLPGVVDQNPAFWLNLGVLYSRTGDFDEAQKMLERGIAEADAKGDLYSAARGWNQLGWEYLERKELAKARRALTEGFRLRKMLKTSEMATSYQNLGMLSQAEGDGEVALRLLDEAIAQGVRNGSGVPLWVLFHHRGKVRLEQRSFEAGISDLETATELARRWRAGILPVESLQNSAGLSVQKVYDEYIEACMAEYKRTGVSEWALKAFLAAELDRALILQERLIDRRRLSPEFWQRVTELRQAEFRLLQQGSAENRKAAARARLRLMEVEIAAGLGPSAIPVKKSHQKKEIIGSDNALLQLGKGLSAQEALISFHVGDHESWVWVLQGKRFAVNSAPARSRLTEKIEQFREAIQSHSPQLNALARALYADLFGGMDRQAQASREWLLAPDGPLYDLPFAALIRDGRYLAQDVAIRVLASGVAASRGTEIGAGKFVGFGDAVYNVADSRWSGRKRSTPAELTRLPGSGKELEVCSRAMPPGTVAQLFTGSRATRAALEAALREPARILHLATHVIPRRDIPDQNWIALGLTAEGEPDFMTPVEIAASRSRVGLVAMTGCGSGTGEPLPGTGLLGLARAWLVSGAGAVAASLWPVRDDVSELFQNFYRHLGNPGIQWSRAAAQALRQAQVDMLKSGDWRGQPRYWAAFFYRGEGLALVCKWATEWKQARLMGRKQMRLRRPRLAR